MQRRAILFTFVMLLFLHAAWGCDLCAVYNTDAARGELGQGFSFTLSEQFIPCGTVQLNGNELPPSVLDQNFVDSSMTHIVPTWNFSDRFGISANLPLIHRRFDRFQLTPSGVVADSGTESGIGDLSLIARYNLLRQVKGSSSLTVNLLAGVKFPTGDPSRVEEEVELTRQLDLIYGPGHQHAVSGVHLRDLTLGSGSYDGVFGITGSVGRKRLFFNAQFQYYLRTEALDYEFGDELMISGGPGVFVFLEDNFTLSVQALAVYDWMKPDNVLGRQNLNTGMTAVYIGPQIVLTIGQYFSANLGVDIPLNIENDGLQNVPDYRFHAGASVSF